MDLRIMFVMAVLSAAFVALAVPADKSSAQTAKDIVGTWTLISNEADQGGRKVEPFGSNAKGIVFDATKDIVGPYAVTIPAEALMANKHEASRAVRRLNMAAFPPMGCCFLRAEDYYHH